MFETEFPFEEFPITFGNVAIELEGNFVDDYRDKRKVSINAKSDDPLAALLFKQLAARIEADQSASDHYYAEYETQLAA
ncbi:MAG: hypothetical protein AAF724_10365 [Pseudomonadota bacterium]